MYSKLYFCQQIELFQNIICQFCTAVSVPQNKKNSEGKISTLMYHPGPKHRQNQVQRMCSEWTKTC